jgi:hypothetical protein
MCIFSLQKYSDEKLANVSDVVILFDEDVKDDKIDIYKNTHIKNTHIKNDHPCHPNIPLLTFILDLSPQKSSS